MNQPTPPAPPSPAKESVKGITPHFWESTNFWTSAVGVASAVASFLSTLAGIAEANPTWKIRLLLAAAGTAALAGFLGNLGSIFGKRAATEAAAVVSERLDLHEINTGSSLDA
jgi:hypothetical protein